MSYRDRLQEATGVSTTQNTWTPKKIQIKRCITESIQVRDGITIDVKNPMFVSFKKNDDGSYTKETIGDSLNGILLGSYYRIKATNQGGASYVQTTGYFTKQDLVKIFGLSTPPAAMSPEQAKEFLKVRFDTVKTVACVVFLTHEGIIEIETNVSLWIEVAKKLSQTQVALDYVLILKAEVFKRELHEKKYRVPDGILKLSEDKTPTFFEALTQGAQTIEEVAELWKLDAAITAFEGQKSKLKSQVSHTQSSPQTTNRPPSTIPVSESGDDDLPF